MKPNLQKALACYRTAAAQNNEAALNYLGAHCFNVERNEVDAVSYFRQAAASGKCARAINNLALCFENGCGGC